MKKLCVFCKKQFDSKLLLFKHIKSAHQKRMLELIKTYINFEYGEYLKEHYKKVFIK